MDCYATWCAPCKLMDKNVYPNDSVSNLINSNFLAIKVQLDSSKHDDDEIQKWYSTANKLKIDYSITTTPTFLFFSPDGKIMHRDEGLKSVPQFLSLGTDARNPDMQYYTLIKRYKDGKLNYQQMCQLAHTAKRLNDEIVSDVSKRCIEFYLKKLPNDSFYSKIVLTFLSDFIDSSYCRNRLSELCFEEPKNVDSKMYPGFSKGVIDFVIAKEYILPDVNYSLDKNTIPDWNGITKKIALKYGEVYAHTNVLTWKVDFYKRKKKWRDYTKSIIEKVEGKGMFNFKGENDQIDLNNYAWEVFFYSISKRELKKALIWIEYSLKMDSSSFVVPNCIDTKANLLYKLGQKKRAIELEEKSIALLPGDQGRKNTIKKIKEDQPTWYVTKPN